MKKRISFVLVVLLALLCLSGCQDKNTNHLAGKWTKEYDESVYFDFQSETALVTNEGEYTVENLNEGNFTKEGKFSLTDMTGNTKTYTYSIIEDPQSGRDKYLVLTYDKGEQVTLTKAE